MLSQPEPYTPPTSTVSGARSRPARKGAASAATKRTCTWSLSGKEFPAQRGDVLYVEPWVYHGVTNTGKEPLIFLVVRYNGKGLPVPPRPDDQPDEL